MPSANKTEKIQLNQWQGNEYPKRIDFNDDNLKIDNKFKEIDTELSDLTYKIATGTATAIILTMPTLVNGYAKTFIASANNGGVTTTINGKPLYKPNTTTAPNLTGGKAYTIWYDSTKNCFFIKASAEGTALAKDVRKNTTFSNDNDTGIAGGLDLSLLVSGNIRAGVTIDGVSGKSTVVDTQDAVLDPAYLVTGYSGYDDGVKKAGTLANLTGTRSATGVSKWGDGALAVYPERGYQKGGSGDGEIKVTPSQLQSVEGNLIASNILSGRSVFGIGGGIPLLNPSWGDQKEISQVSVGAYSYGNGANYAYFQVPNGQYLNGVNWISHWEPDLIAQNIVAGRNILGIWGSASIQSLGGWVMYSTVINVPWTYETFIDENGYSGSRCVIDVTGFNFMPKFAICTFGSSTTIHTKDGVSYCADVGGVFTTSKNPNMIISNGRIRIPTYNGGNNVQVYIFGQ